jgi:pimeloyl-ACP methyl ester carboxylesterase
VQFLKTFIADHGWCESYFWGRTLGRPTPGTDRRAHVGRILCPEELLAIVPLHRILARSGPPRRRRRAALVIAVLILLAASMLLWVRPLATHGKVLLLLSQELPFIPVKPLQLLTAAPIHEQLRLDSERGPVLADLFLPARGFGAEAPRSQPAVILAMGVKTSERDRPIMLSFARTLARLGFVALWPRSEALDAGVSLPEEPATFVSGVRYLRELDQVDPDRISILGFSIGASVALVAASDARIADGVPALIFFGGYYDIFSYIASIATRSIVVDGQVVPWEPHEDVAGHFHQILENKRAYGLLRIFGAATRDEAELVLRSVPPTEVAELQRYSPAEHLGALAARLFVLHDRGDRFVPYVESLTLRRAAPDALVGAFLLTDLFEHAQPKEGLSWQALADIVSVYRFAYAVVSEL